MFVFTATSKINFAIGEKISNTQVNFWIRKFSRSLWLDEFRNQAQFFQSKMGVIPFCIAYDQNFQEDQGKQEVDLLE